MKLVFWNIRAGGGVRADRISNQLIAWNPDTIALAEFRGTEPSRGIAQSLRDTGYIHQRTTVQSATPALNSLLIASRWPLRRIRLARSPVEAPRWLHVIVQSPVPYAVLALHIPNRSTGRKYPFMQSVLDVVESWRGPPAILMGDTNSGRIDIDEESPAFNHKEDQWLSKLDSLHWIDAFRHLNPQKREFTWYSPNGKNGFRLDQMFLHPQFTTQPYQLRHIWGGYTGKPLYERRDGLSDHAALILEASLTIAEAAT